MTHKQDVLRLIQKLESQGWEVVLGRRSGHYKARCPEGRTYGFGSTPSDYRGMRNLVSALRRMGADL